MKTLLKLLLVLAAWGALAQPYPSKPIRVVVAFPPGGPVDIVARLLAPSMGDALGQPVLVENKTGASGNIASTEVAKAGPDGYTVLAHSSAYAVNPTLFKNPGYDPNKDLVPIAVVASQPNIIIVNAAFPAKTLDELRKEVLARKLAYASPGAGTTPHLTAESLFRVRWKADITHVPFRGAGPAVAALVAGEPAVGSAAGAGPMPHIKSGKLRALAVSSAKRLATLPDVPTLAELGYSGMEDYTWVGLFVPAGTPRDVAQKLNAAVLKAAQGPKVRERLESLAFDVTAGPLAESADYVRAEVVKWAKVVRDTGARVD